jgi:uncharacterized protein YfbU (UPF0304 family)
MAQVLREGYASEYHNVFGGTLPEVPMSECELVRDILTMFRVVGASIDRLPTHDRAALGEESERQLRFGGFDESDHRETRLLSYVEYMVANGEWEELRPRLVEIGDGGNSHSRRLPNYERMLAVYMPFHDDTERWTSRDGMLTVDELKQIADAWPWPGN